jgi:hypothetical protein
MSTTPSEIKIESAKPLASLTAAERKKRFDELRAKLGKSRLEVKGKPGIHYFYAHKTDDGERIRLESIGYWIVREPNAKAVMKGEAKPEIIANGLHEDGTYQIGDVILMACPIELYELQLLEEDERRRDESAAVKQNFRLEAEKQGVPTFEFDTPRRK